MMIKKRNILCVAVAALCITTLSACKRDARLADQELRHPVVKTVSHYGVTLDKNASPKQVAFVALRAIKDDFEAANDEQRGEALDVLFDICAPNLIAAHNRKSVTRDEYIFKVVYRWTPAVAHYVNDFETEWTKADARFITRPGRSGSSDGGKDGAGVLVLMDVADPEGDSNAGAVVSVDVVKDKGFWRVRRVGFASNKRSINGSSTQARTARSVTPTQGG